MPSSRESRLSWTPSLAKRSLSTYVNPQLLDADLQIRFNPNMSELVDAEHLDTEFGGSYNLEYDYATYWPTLTKFCNLVRPS
jgi:hypothetical protein